VKEIKQELRINDLISNVKDFFTCYCFEKSNVFQLSTSKSPNVRLLSGLTGYRRNLEAFLGTA